jgi:HK97 family phage major capsid protein
MATVVEEMRHKLQVVIKERQTFAATFNAENIPSPEDEAKLDAMYNGEADLREQIKRSSRFEEASAALPNASVGDTATPPNMAKVADMLPRKTFGQRFTESAQYKAAREQYAPDDRIPDGGNFRMAGLGFKGLADLGMRADLITGGSSTSAGAFVIADRFQELQPLGRAPLTILDLIRVLTTSSDLVEYVAQTARTNNAAEIDEATGSGDGTGVKPESAFTYVVRSAPVSTIPNWIPVTRQAMADVPQLRGYIDTELRDNVREALANAVLNGATPGIVGILQTSGRQSQAYDTNVLTTTRKARTKVRTVGRTTPTGYLMNPSDWEAIDLLQDNEARYFYGGPAAVLTPRLWGLPVAEEENIAAGDALVGNFQKAIMWDREQSTISVSDSHSDFFIRNLLAILAEMRAAFALVQPSAMVEIDLTP